MRGWVLAAAMVAAGCGGTSGPGIVDPAADGSPGPEGAMQAPEGGAAEDAGTPPPPGAHSDGEGHSWSDGTAAGTYTFAEAYAACNAFAPGGVVCSGAPEVACGGHNDTMVLALAFPPLAADAWAWVYQGPDVGQVLRFAPQCVADAQGNTPSTCTVGVATVLCDGPMPPAPPLGGRTPFVVVAQWQ